MSRPLFQLGPRLALCARLLEGGRPLCDVGTDHAYLPIWLLKQGIVPLALACDVRPGPLEAARENAGKYRVGKELVLRLSDGLWAVSPEEAGEIVIAGMGGELILRIVTETPWLREPGRRLVLQPMSSAPELRAGLAQAGFSVWEEQAVLDGERVYSAMAVGWTGDPPSEDELFPLMGALSPGTEEVRRYAQKVLRELEGRLEGARRGRTGEDPRQIEVWMEQIHQRFLEG